MKLYHFSSREFDRGGENWYDRMNPRLLVLVDVLRFMLGVRISISPHHRALGRRHWPNPKSDHAIDERGTVDGMDVFVEGVQTRKDARRVIEAARSIGITAIGFYPHWEPQCGFHFGQRDERLPGAPATWGAIRKNGVQTYVSLDVALAEMRL